MNIAVIKRGRSFLSFFIVIAIAHCVAPLNAAPTPGGVVEKTPGTAVVVPRLGHLSEVTLAGFTADGKIGVTRAGNAIYTWDTQTGQLLRKVIGEVPPRDSRGRTYISSVHLSPDGSTIAVVQGLTSSSNKAPSITLWNLRTGAQTKELAFADPAPTARNSLGMDWSPDSKTIATAGLGQPVTLWDVDSGTVRSKLAEETSNATLVRFSPDGKVLKTSTGARRVAGRAGAAPAEDKLWEAETGQPATAPVGGELPADLQAFEVLAQGVGGRVLLGDSVRQDVELMGRVIPGRRVISTVPVFWNPATKKAVRGERMGGSILNPRFSPDGQRVIATSFYRILLWDTETGAQSIIPIRPSASEIALSPDASTILTGYDDGTVALYEARHAAPPPADPKAIATLTAATARWRAPGRASVQVATFAIAPDGASLMAAYADGTLANWNLRTGALSGAVSLPGFRLATLAYSPDGKTLATSQVREQRTSNLMEAGVPPSDVRLWDMATGTVRKVIPVNDSRSTWHTLAFSPDSALLVGLHDSPSAIRAGSPGIGAPTAVWDVLTGESKGSIEGGYGTVGGVAFAPSGKLLAMSDSNGLRLFDLPEFRRRKFQDHGMNDPHGVGFTLDGKFVITGGSGLRLTDTEKVTEGSSGFATRFSKENAGDSVRTFALAPNGRHAVTGSPQGTLKTWDLAALAPIITVAEAHDAAITKVAYTPSGALIISSGYEGDIKVWDAGTGQLRLTLTRLPSRTPAVVPPTQPNAPIPNPDGTQPPAPVPITVDWLSHTPTGAYRAGDETAIAALVDWRNEGKTLVAAERKKTFEQPATVERALVAASQ